MASREESSNSSTKFKASVTDILQNSLMFFPPTVTARYSGFSRSPWQSGQGTELMTWVISSRIKLDWVSRNRRSRLLTIPSNSVS